MTGQHAILSPSGFKALMLCPGKPAMERGRPDEASEYAAEGTAAHFLGAFCLEQGQQAPLHLGREIVVSDDFTGFAPEIVAGLDPAADIRTFRVTAEMAEAVQIYIDTVRDYQGSDGTLFVEQELPIDHITGEEGAEGTGDAIIVRGSEIIVIDLKYGKGVEVSAEDNPQLKLYGLGALRKFDLVGDIARVRTVISQPRVSSAPSEVDYTVSRLTAWGEGEAKTAARISLAMYTGECPDLVLKPAEDACRFCKAKGDCPALAGAVQEALGREFTDLTTADAIERDAIVETSVATADAAGELGARMDAVPLVEIWCKAIRARVEKHLLDGKPVEGYKLVQGKRGNRAWSDETLAEAVMKKMRLKKEQMYEFKVISPTTAEKVLKATPKRWAKVQTLITQPDGKPSVAPLSDKRPALEVKTLESEFTPIASETPVTADDLV
jgi:hypothetical protein